jgi:hypothetical protein
MNGWVRRFGIEFVAAPGGPPKYSPAHVATMCAHFGALLEPSHSKKKQYLNCEVVRALSVMYRRVFVGVPLFWIGKG